MNCIETQLYYKFCAAKGIAVENKECLFKKIQPAQRPMAFKKDIYSGLLEKPVKFIEKNILSSFLFKKSLKLALDELEESPSCMVFITAQHRLAEFITPFPALFPVQEMENLLIRLSNSFYNVYLEGEKQKLKELSLFSPWEKKLLIIQKSSQLLKN